MAAAGMVVTRADESIAEALQWIWTRELDHLERQIPGVIEGRDDECLHQFRVALRRTRALLKALDKALPPHVQLASELKWLSASTGALRDLDVHYADFRVWLGPSWSGAGLIVLETIHQRRLEAHAELVELLRGERCRALLCDWRRFLYYLPGNPSRQNAAAIKVERWVPERVKKLSRRLRECGGAIQSHSPDVMLHQVRIRGKRLRYLLESFEPIFGHPRRMRNLIRTLKDLQDVLGRHQDCVVARHAFRALAESSDLEGGAVFELGRWDRELELRQRRAREAFPAKLQAFADACGHRPWRR